jgi:ubiquinone/menaquinone biosynthesis C-methylase UbiE
MFEEMPVRANLRNPKMVGPFTDPAGYDRHTGLFHKLYGRVVADAARAGLPDAARVLDVGTGPGRIPRALAAEHPQWSVDAVDLDPGMIAYARGRDLDGSVSFAVGDVADLPYPDGTFDLVVSSMSQHHWTDVEGALRSLRRVLRPGGRLWIYDVRFVLRRAGRAARISFGSDAVRVEPVPTGHLPLTLYARLSARA